MTDVRDRLAEVGERRRPLLQRRSELDREARELMTELKPLVVLADVRGVPRAEIARLAGISRQTVYEIIGEQ